jgi:hypothetical protein
MRAYKHMIICVFVFSMDAYVLCIMYYVCILLLVNKSAEPFGVICFCRCAYIHIYAHVGMRLESTWSNICFVVVVVLRCGGDGAPFVGGG